MAISHLNQSERSAQVRASSDQLQRPSPPSEISAERAVAISDCVRESTGGTSTPGSQRDQREASGRDQRLCEHESAGGTSTPGSPRDQREESGRDQRLRMWELRASGARAALGSLRKRARGRCGSASCATVARC